MKKILFFLVLTASQIIHSQVLVSPSKSVQATFRLTASGQPVYAVSYKNKAIITESALGFELKDLPALQDNFEIVSTDTRSFSENWKPVLGEVASIKNEYNELKIFLRHKSDNRLLNIVFRAFDEGIAFRYEFPKQDNLNFFVVKNELTAFNLTGDHKTFWIPGDYDSNEYVYLETPISGIDVAKVDTDNGIGAPGRLEKYRVQTPLMMKSKEGIYINIFEAAAINYPVLHLDTDVKNNSFKANLAPNAIGDKAYLQTGFVSPWRTIMVSSDARDIVASKMILNLNEPSKLEDTSWIKPMKYVGIWWEMHVNRGTWNYADKYETDVNKLIPNGKHSATTANTKHYIDFAAKNGFDGVLIEGWNTGWEEWTGNWKEEVFDFTTAYPDFDVKALESYAKSKNVKLIMHHETAGSVANYERRLDRAFTFMKDNGYDAVKTGYVGKIIPRGEWHDGQTMVNHFNYVPQRAAEYKIMVNSHESVRPTGVSRTWPNYIAAEAARGNEFNGWSVGNPPAHETILPFTRLLGGPMDYTPGIFEIKMSYYDPKKKEQVHTTLAKQLALYVTIYSPLQMAADLPENYERYADAFQFIKDVAVDWEDTKVLEAEPGDYITIARKAKGKEQWFLGAITDEQARETSLKLDFLTPGKKYQAIVYEDGPAADWEKNPKSYKIRKLTVTAKSKLNLNLAAGGGAAVSFFPL